jgi:hypothetical protein
MVIDELRARSTEADSAVLPWQDVPDKPRPETFVLFTLDELAER